MGFRAQSQVYWVWVVGGGGYENKVTPNIDPQAIGLPYNKDPNKVPLSS